MMTETTTTAAPTALLPAMRCRQCDAELLGPARRGGDGAVCNACLDAITETTAGVRGTVPTPAPTLTLPVGAVAS